MPNLQQMNLNYLLNKAYYEPMSHSHFGECNNALTRRRFQVSKETIPFSAASFCLKTTYPGLLIGIGNTHEAGTGVTGADQDGAEIKLGFTLDYVTGLPIIPGSTVKGVLCSVFKNHADYVCGLLGVEENVVKDIKTAIFAEGVNKVVFFDAIPIRTGKDNRIFGLENITPHSDELKSPTPLTLLKVIPNVVFLFRFGVEAWKECNNVPAERLMNAFNKILCDLGIGAKTNVGFGAMESAETPSPYFYLESETEFTNRAEHQKTRPQTARAVIKSDGVCKWEGCFEKTKQKSTGDFHPYCQTHFLEIQKKRG